MRSRALFIAIGSILCAAAAQAGCGGNGNGTGGAGGTGGSGGKPSTSVTSTSTTGTGGQGGTGGSGGSGGAPNKTPDKCPGEAHTLGTGKLMLSGSTVGLQNTIQVNSGKCVGGADTSGPDAVYAITFTKDSTTTITATGTNGLDAVLIAEGTCGDMSSVIDCENETMSGSEQQTFATANQDVHAGSQTVFVIVGGNSGSAGDFTLNIDAEPGACGDGYINTGEQCDDGNTVDGDGCSSTCQFELPMDTSDTCPGDAVPLALSVPLELKGMMYPAIGEATTVPYHDDYTTCDGLGPPPEGKDRVFQVIPATDGTMHIELRNIGSNGGFDGMLSAWRDTCGFTSSGAPGPALAFDGAHDAPSGNYLGCSDQATGMDPYLATDSNTFEVLDDFAVTGGESIFVVVDGYQLGSEGEFWLHLELN